MPRLTVIASHLCEPLPTYIDMLQARAPDDTLFWVIDQTSARYSLEGVSFCPWCGDALTEIKAPAKTKRVKKASVDATT